MHENQIGSLILNAAFKVHSELVPGLLESAYEACLVYESREMGLYVETQTPLPLIYKKVKLECGYRVDLLAEHKIIVEIKTVETLTPVHLAQVLTYLKCQDVNWDTCSILMLSN